MSTLRRIAIDIETMAAPPVKLAEIPEPEVAIGNLKDPAKIAEKIEKAKADQIRLAALDPHFAEIVCVGVYHDDKPFIAKRDHVDEMAEVKLLRWVWNTLRAYDQIITYNGASFDIPFLIRRSLLLGVEPLMIDCGRYSVIKPECQHFDVYRYLQQWNVGNAYGGGSPLGYKQDLRFYVREFLGESCVWGDFDKSMMRAMWESENTSDIVEGCAWDVQMTYQLAQKLVFRS